jgi:hypothetical protein
VRNEVTARFAGFPDFRSNVTFVPIQFFTVVIPNVKGATIRLVAYMLRQVLGWVDRHGNPTRAQLQFSYAELAERAGLSRAVVVDAIEEALENHLIWRVPNPVGQPPRRVVEGAIYALCWDTTAEKLTHDWEAFRGFYYPEATVEEEIDGQRITRRPKAARKNIPNAFFDHLIRRERKAVIRVVGALLFRSIQWGPGGERRVPVTCSITELSRLTNLWRRHAHAAIVEACRRGYLEQVETGYFDPAAGQASRTATYAIRWVKRPEADGTDAVSTQPKATPPGAREDGQYGKVNGESVRKGKREQVQKVNGKERNKVNGINIKQELKTKHKTTAAEAGLPAAATDAAAADGFALLVKAGFDEQTARQLDSRHTTEAIQQQLDWLPLRRATRNRLGLLRLAIEQNWARPEGAKETPDNKLGRLFASHYYAGYHGYTGAATTEPFPKDVALAGQFVERLLRQQPDESLIPEWGRRFGRMMREKHQAEPRTRPHLSTALVLYGDKFLRLLDSENAARQKEALGRPKAAHQTAFLSAYMNYLRQAETDLQRGSPEVYGAFVAEQRKARHALTSSPFPIAAAWLQRFDSEDSRLRAFAEFFAGYPQHQVLNFWDWDAQKNPLGFGRCYSDQPGIGEPHP